jgi:hypothetical protein
LGKAGFQYLCKCIDIGPSSEICRWRARLCVNLCIVEAFASGGSLIRLPGCNAGTAALSPVCANSLLEVSSYCSARTGQLASRRFPRLRCSITERNPLDQNSLVTAIAGNWVTAKRAQGHCPARQSLCELTIDNRRVTRRILPVRAASGLPWFALTTIGVSSCFYGCTVPEKTASTPASMMPRRPLLMRRQALCQIMEQRSGAESVKARVGGSDLVHGRWSVCVIHNCPNHFFFGRYQQVSERGHGHDSRSRSLSRSPIPVRAHD